jgi:NDP-sugar pyrophosphorylase family protein
VILAGGRGTRIGRVGDALHKALVPLSGKAIISHQIERAPAGARIIISVGHRAEQIRSYVQLAHPNSGIMFVEAKGWDQPGAGPGTGLLACRDAVAGDDLIFTTCDTLWDDYDLIAANYATSWCGVAPVPAGTPPARWCRMQIGSLQNIVRIVDKDPQVVDSMAYVGLAFIKRSDLEIFWHGIDFSGKTAGELQITGGFIKLIDDYRQLHAHRIHWTDVGDEESYRHAVSRYDGFDWVKLDQATYVLPETKRVVKFHSDATLIAQRIERAKYLGDAVPQPIELTTEPNMFAYEYLPGISGYEYAEGRGTSATHCIMQWFESLIWNTRTKSYVPSSYAMSFYRDKTFERIAMLPPDMRARCLDVATRIDWPALVKNCVYGTWLGDCNLGNMIISSYPDKETLGVKIYGIDWRESFAGYIPLGDLRYDLAKLIAGTVVHWDNARRGDFRPWDSGVEHKMVMQEYVKVQLKRPDLIRDVEIIAALSLINSAPLHASPLDEILVSRGVAWLEEIL